MSRFRPQHLLRLAVIVLLALNVVPEAFAAFPVCNVPGSSAAASSIAAAKAALRHSHGLRITHECMATMPDRQSITHQVNQTSPDNSVAIVPVVAHPAAMLAARGPSPRGSPLGASLWLTQRSSVLLLI